MNEQHHEYQPSPSSGDEHDPAPSPELERQPGDEPRIYVACLAAYNNGQLHGRWMHAGRMLDDLKEDIRQMLAVSPIPRAEEYAIHDYDGFGPLQLGEYESIERVNRIAEGIVEHGMAFAHWAAHLGSSTDEDELSRFEEQYVGHWPTLTEYAEELLQDLGVDQALDQLDESFRPYVTVDVDAYARDIAVEHIVSEGEGGVHVFLPW